MQGAASAFCIVGCALVCISSAERMWLQDSPARFHQHVAQVADCRNVHYVYRDKELVHTLAVNERAQQSLEQQLDEARAKLARALAGRQQLEQRRALDVEGFTADIALLRKALTATDRCVSGRENTSFPHRDRGSACCRCCRCVLVCGDRNNRNGMVTATSFFRRRLHQMRLADRLEHDERLEALLEELQACPGAEVDAAVLEDISNIAGRR